MTTAKRNTMKLGHECEGRLKGLYTLFMSAIEARQFFDFASIKERALPKGSADSIDKVRHIYISDPGNTLVGNSECLTQWAAMGMPVTLEVTAVSGRRLYPRNVSLMFNISDCGGAPNTSFWRLHRTDQVKFTQGLGKFTSVMCVTVENMTRTFASDFEGDVSFVPSKAKKF